MCTAFRCDNCGPPSDASEVLRNYAHWRSEFPGAHVMASSFDAFVEKLYSQLPHLKLPEVVGEIGDTWIYGVSSDPWKIANYRAAARARAKCLATGRCLEHEPAFFNFSR